MIKINSSELAALIDEETVTMRGCPAYSKFESVVGVVNGQVVVLTLMNKAKASEEFCGSYINLNLVTDNKD